MDRKTFFGNVSEAIGHYQALEKYFTTTSIDPILRQLIKIRSSQINGCAYCLNMHTIDAFKIGENQQRMHLLNAWRETSLFTDKEKAVLDLVEKITLIHTHEVDKQTKDNVLKYFTEQEFSNIVVMIVTINAWNRFFITLESDIDHNYR